jgi:hypothetical protein
MLKVLVLIGAMISVEAYADFLPPNDLHLEDNIHSFTGLSEEQFNQVLNRIEEVYAPIVDSLGGVLRIRRNWRSSTVNANASRLLNRWIVRMYGGLARRPEVTPDGFALVVCHEIGHHVAGFPTLPFRWAAAEGQSDYFATLACGRSLWQDDVEGNRMARSAIPDYPKSRCDAVYSDENDQNLCYRQVLAGYSLANLLSAVSGGSGISFETTDPHVTDKTFVSHPQAQCRLDTYTAGALCTAQWDDHVTPKSEADSANYTCNLFQGFGEGTRPLCWFKPAM